MGFVLSLVMQFWKQIVVVLAVIALVWFVKNAWEERYQDGYDEGVRVTEEAQALVLAKRTIENEKREAALKAESKVLVTELEGKLNVSELIADNLRAELRTRRVCTDEIYPGPVPANPSGSAESNGSAVDAGPSKTVGDRLVEIGKACQDNTDRLITLQKWVRELEKAHPIPADHGP